MISNGRLLVLLPETPPSLSSGDDLSSMHNDITLRRYFRMSGGVTVVDTVCAHVKNENNHQTIVVAERGFFATEQRRMDFKKTLEGFGVPSDHILFGEDYASGRHHILLAIHKLCE